MGTTTCESVRSKSRRKAEPDIRSLRLAYKMLKTFASIAGGSTLNEACKKHNLHRVSFNQALRINTDLVELDRIVRDVTRGASEFLYTPERMTTVLSRLRGGATIREAVADMPFSADGYKFRIKRFPEEKQRHLEARAAGSLRGVDVMQKITSVLPKNMNDDMRMEITQTLCVMLLAGEITLKDLPKSVKYAKTDYWKTAPSKFGPASLEALRFDGGNTTLHDTISVGLWDN